MNFRSFFIAFTILFSIVLFGSMIYQEIKMEQNCTGYLKRAADANTVELAKVELEKCIAYLEANDLTTGYTSIIYNTPDEDISFWYTNIKDSHRELTLVTDSTTSLEKSNILMKLRETLLDNEKLSAPTGLARFPNNGLWCVGSCMAFIMIVVGVGMVLTFD